jgi:hypothetical protein
VTSGGKMCSKGTPIIKKVQPLLFLSNEEQQKKEKKNKSFDIEQIYGHGSQRGSMPGVTVLAVSFCSALCRVQCVFMCSSNSERVLGGVPLK